MKKKIARRLINMQFSKFNLNFTQNILFEQYLILDAVIIVRIFAFFSFRVIIIFIF